MGNPSPAQRQAEALERIEQLLVMTVEERLAAVREMRDAERQARIGRLRDHGPQTREERWLLFLRAVPHMMSVMHRMPDDRYRVTGDGMKVECRCGLEPLVETDHECVCRRYYVALGDRLYVVVQPRDDEEGDRTGS